jgi:hypothetical protein
MSYRPDPPKGAFDGRRDQKVWDSCTSCFDPIELSKEEWDWRQCRRCKAISCVLKITLSAGAAFALYELWTSTRFKNSTLDLYTLGYLIDILGGWFLASGLSDLFALASSGFGGGGITFKRFGRRNFYRRSIGLFLLTLGFILQCIANIAAYRR